MTTGSVLRIYTVLTNPPKRKIVLCVGEYMFLWFNTNARKGRPAQMPVKPGEVPGITQASFLDCGRVTTFMEREIVNAEICGVADNQFMDRVLEQIEEHASSLAPGQREAICTAIREAMRRP